MRLPRTAAYADKYLKEVDCVNNRKCTVCVNLKTFSDFCDSIKLKIKKSVRVIFKNHQNYGKKLENWKKSEKRNK